MIEWIITNWDNILAWIGGIVSCASIIVRLTPSTKDNAVLDKIIKILDNFSIVNTKENQKKIDG